LGLALDEPKDNDATYDQDTLQFLVETELMKSCGAIKIDYADAGYHSGFSITSTIPLSGGGGGCGGSCSSGSCG